MSEPEDFVSDAEIARRWRVSDKTARVAIQEFGRRPGFPPKDPLFGGKRYWPAVCAFMRRRAGINIGASLAPHGKENWDADPSKNRQRPRSALAPAR